MANTEIEYVGKLAAEARQELWELAKEAGHDNPKIYLHWTAGRYYNTFDHYHICIMGGGEIYLPADDLVVGRDHTWKRNKGGVGVALCCAYGAGSNSLGDYPPTTKQIETMAQVIAALCKGLWLTPNKQCVLTHGEAANNEDGERPHLPYAWWNDGYGDGDTRGDLEYLGTPESPRYNPFATDGTRGGDVLRGKAAWYMANWEKEIE